MLSPQWRSKSSFARCFYEIFRKFQEFFQNVLTKPLIESIIFHIKPMRKSSSKGKLQHREPQAVGLRYGVLGEWTSEGEGEFFSSS